MSSHGRRVFLIGTGFIGSNILEALVDRGYQVSALVRRKEAAEEIKKHNAEPILGELKDKATITKHVFENDIVIHTATADDLPSVEAVLEGIVQRAEKELPTIYLHTSGAMVFDDGAAGASKTDKIYSDEDQAHIDTVADSAPHRSVDLAILKAKKEIGRKAKIAIIMPPLIYGYVERYGRLSIQIPILAKYALKHGHAGTIGKGLSVLSTVHVRDLMTGYLTVLHHLEKTSTHDEALLNPYYFIEANGDHEPSWADIAQTIAEGLQKAGKVQDTTIQTIPESDYGEFFGPATPAVFGGNSRTRADRLKKLGWKPTHKDWRSSFLEDELPVILQQQE